MGTVSEVTVGLLHMIVTHGFAGSIPRQTPHLRPGPGNS